MSKATSARDAAAAAAMRRRLISGSTASISISRSAEPAACDNSPQTSLNWPSPLAANTANSTNWPSRAGRHLACDARPGRRPRDHHDARGGREKMMIAVSIARARSTECRPR
jgi:hypothetical protein